MMAPQTRRSLFLACVAALALHVCVAPGVLADDSTKPTGAHGAPRASPLAASTQSVQIQPTGAPAVVEAHHMPTAAGSTDAELAVASFAAAKSGRHRPAHGSSVPVGRVGKRGRRVIDDGPGGLGLPVDSTATPAAWPSPSMSDVTTMRVDPPQEASSSSSGGESIGSSTTPAPPRASTTPASTKRRGSVRESAVSTVAATSASHGPLCGRVRVGVHPVRRALFRAGAGSPGDCCRSCRAVQDCAVWAFYDSSRSFTNGQPIDDDNGGVMGNMDDTGKDTGDYDPSQMFGRRDASGGAGCYLFGSAYEDVLQTNEQWVMGTLRVLVSSSSVAANATAEPSTDPVASASTILSASFSKTSAALSSHSHPVTLAVASSVASSAATHGSVASSPRSAMMHTGVSSRLSLDVSSASPPSSRMPQLTTSSQLSPGHVDTFAPHVTPLATGLSSSVAAASLFSHSSDDSGHGTGVSTTNPAPSVDPLSGGLSVHVVGELLVTWPTPAVPMRAVAVGGRAPFTFVWEVSSSGAGPGLAVLALSNGNAAVISPPVGMHSMRVVVTDASGSTASAAASVLVDGERNTAVLFDVWTEWSATLPAPDSAVGLASLAQALAASVGVPASDVFVDSVAAMRACFQCNVFTACVVNGSKTVPPQDVVATYAAGRAVAPVANSSVDIVHLHAHSQGTPIADHCRACIAHVTCVPGRSCVCDGLWMENPVKQYGAGVKNCDWYMPLIGGVIGGAALFIVAVLWAYRALRRCCGRRHHRYSLINYADIELMERTPSLSADGYSSSGDESELETPPSGTRATPVHPSSSRNGTNFGFDRIPVVPHKT
eukprot:Opistho-2@30077